MALFRAVLCHYQYSLSQIYKHLLRTTLETWKTLSAVADLDEWRAQR